MPKKKACTCGQGLWKVGSKGSGKMCTRQYPQPKWCKGTGLYKAGGGMTVQYIDRTVFGKPKDKDLGYTP